MTRNPTLESAIGKGRCGKLGGYRGIESENEEIIIGSVMLEVCAEGKTNDGHDLSVTNMLPKEVDVVVKGNQDGEGYSRKEIALYMTSVVGIEN